MIFIDRSGWETYHQRCARRYYFERHAGPTEHGFVPAYGDVPLLTGGLIHDPIWQVNATVQADPRADVTEVARGALRDVTKTYLEIAQLHGLTKAPGGMTREEAIALGLPLPDDRVSAEDRAREQLSLIEGFLWLYCWYVLPEILARGRIVWVEREATRLLDGTCTCGKPHEHDWRAHGTWKKPAALGVIEAVGWSLADWAKIGVPQAQLRFEPRCAGVFFSATPDLILERFSDQALEYHEFKTQAAEGRVEQWQFKPQFAAGAFAAEPYLLRRIDTYAVHLFLKGDMKGEYDSEKGDYSGPKRQQSPLCYVYHRPGIPGVQPDDWQPRWDYVDESGRHRKLGKPYRKVPLWQQVFPRQASLSPVEYWIRVLAARDPAYFSGVYRYLGPFARQTWMEGDWMLGVTLWAQRVQQTLAELRAIPTSGVGAESATAQTAVLMESTFAQSWDCFPFREQSCPYLWICGREAGWQRPWESDKVLYRFPHHEAEATAAIARGLIAVDAPATDGGRGVGSHDDE